MAYRKGFGKGIAAVALLAIAFGCTTTDGYWERAVEADTIEAYQEFLGQHGDSQHADEAKARIELCYAERDFELARQANTTAAYEEYVGRHCDPQHLAVYIGMGNKKADRVAQYCMAAMDRLELLWWEAAKSVNDISAYEDFLGRYSRSRHATEAKSSIEKLRKKLERETARDSFRVAKVATTVEAQRFLTSYTLGSSSFEPTYESGVPKVGWTFIIVEWTLGDFVFRHRGRQCSGADLVLLSDGEADPGYSFMGDSWRSAEEASYTFPIDRLVSGQRLFIVDKHKSSSLRLRFMERDYPFDDPP